MKKQRTDFISAWGYAGYCILWSLPLLGLFCWFFSCFSKKENLRKFARGVLCSFLIGSVCVILITVLFIGIFPIDLLVSDISVSASEIQNANSATFSVGSIDSLSGEFFKDNTSVCTKNLINCNGLTVEPSSDNAGDYQLFWYNADKIYFGCTSRFSLDQKFEAEFVPEEAEFCRIVIHPSPTQKASKNKSFKIWFWELAEYSSLLSLSTNNTYSRTRFDYLANASENKFNGYDTFGGKEKGSFKIYHNISDRRFHFLFVQLFY